MHRTDTTPRRRWRCPLELLALTLVGLSQLALAGDPPLPLSELGTSLYRGWQGGLYAEGANEPPAAHLERAQSLADAIEPLDAAGQPDAEGWIGMINLGMSNASQEFKVLERLLDSDEGVNPSLRIVNAAQGGIPAEAMANPDHAFWNLALDRVMAAGLSPAQVQVCWIKQALGTVSDPTFPDHVLLLESHLASIARNARSYFPNLRLCYLANRIYGGYTSRVDRGEPLSYESGFAVKRVIAAQIGGDPALNADPLLGEVRAPLLLWGADNWANGASARVDGLAWLLSDYEDDLIHPSPAGEAKAGWLWYNSVGADPVAHHWLFRLVSGQRRVALPPDADASVNESLPDTNFGTLPELRFGWSGAGTEMVSFLRFDASALEPHSITGAKLYLHGINSVGPQVWSVADVNWSETAITWNSRPPLEALLADPAVSWNGDGSVAIGLDPGSPVLGRSMPSLALRRATGSPVRVASREAALGPLLVLRLADKAVPDPALFADGFETETR